MSKREILFYNGEYLLIYNEDCVAELYYQGHSNLNESEHIEVYRDYEDASSILYTNWNLLLTFNYTFIMDICSFAKDFMYERMFNSITSGDNGSNYRKINIDKFELRKGKKD